MKTLTGLINDVFNKYNKLLKATNLYQILMTHCMKCSTSKTINRLKILNPARTQTLDHSACGKSLHSLHYPDSLTCKKHSNSLECKFI